MAKSKKTFALLAIVWTIVIMVGVSMPGKDLPKLNLFDHFDKVVHWVFFFVWCALAWCAGATTTNRFWKVVLCAFVFGFAIEWYQLNFVPGRSFDVWDGIADGIGALSVLGIKNTIKKYIA